MRKVNRNTLRLRAVLQSLNVYLLLLFDTFHFFHFPTKMLNNMKNIVLFLISFLHIVDTNLVAAIRWQCPACIDTAHNLTAAAQTLRSITLTNHITDLTGIHGFSGLTSLNVADNDLTFLPLLPNGLKTFRCSNNRLVQLPALPSGLTVFHCYGNLLTSLPNLPKNLEVFNCSQNRLSALPVLPNTLQSFYCSYNNLSSLPLLPNSITDLGCAVNNLTKIPDLPPNIILLSCFSNPLLKCLPQLPKSLKFLEVSGTVSCLPNPVSELTTYRYDGMVFNNIVMPVCNTLNPNPCGQATAISAELSEKIRIFPTITEGVLFIETDNISIENVVVLNGIGQEVMRTKAKRLDISALPWGMYFVQIQVGKDRLTKKIVKIY
jgi:Secretion system C-terminal sorting domain